MEFDVENAHNSPRRARLASVVGLPDPQMHVPSTASFDRELDIQPGDLRRPQLKEIAIRVGRHTSEVPSRNVYLDSFASQRMASFEAASRIFGSGSV